MKDDRRWQPIGDRLHDLMGQGGRVLDAGCGDGGLVAHLRGRGLEAFGVDPRAPEHPHLTNARVEDLAGEEAYDGIVAVMSLHHAELELACEAFTRLLRTDGVLLVSEFDWPAYDERAAQWLAQVDASASDHSIERWRSEHDDLHAGESLRAALERSFVLDSEARGPYLARMIGRADLEPAERELVAQGSLPAIGLELVCRLRSSRDA